MKRNKALLGAVSSLTLIALTANPALAAGTDAGTPIQNTVQVSFNIGTVPQTVEEATDEFLVDRKVNVTVSEVGGAATIVTPGSVKQVTTFEVTNLSNDVLDFALTAVQQSGGAAAFGGTDNFSGTNTKIYLETDGVAGYSSGDTLVTFIDELAADDTATVYVLADIAIDRETDDIATVTLTADSHLAGGAGLGTELTTSATNTASVIDTILADLSGDTDSDYDGAYSASDDYKVLAALLSATKTSRVVSDPISDVTGGTPMAIPGAVVEYCIAVSNAAGSATGSNIIVTDTLPANLTFVTGSTKVDGTVVSGVCQADGSAGGSFDGTIVSGALSDLDGGDTLTLVFRATID